MRVPWDIHWSWHHQGPEDIAFFKATQPGAFWLLDADEHICRMAWEAVPTAILILRNHAMSEQKDFMLRDPEGCADAHWRDWERDLPALVSWLPREQVAVTGINEPDLDPNHPGAIEAAIRYSIRFVDGGTRHGVPVGALIPSNGWVHQSVQDGPARWDWYYGVLNAIRLGRFAGVPHFLDLHEYCGKEGPQPMWGWMIGRYLWLLEWLKAWGWDPMFCPVRLGELGMDAYATDPTKSRPKERGWNANNISADQYVGWLKWMYCQMAYHPSILGAGVFGYDHQDEDWQSFDIRPIKGKVQAMINSLQAMASNPVAQWGLPPGAIPVKPEYPPEPAPPAKPPLPEDETSTDPAILAEKVRWWMEEYTRNVEYKQFDRANDILYSLIKLDGGLLYRLENILKQR